MQAAALKSGEFSSLKRETSALNPTRRLLPRRRVADETGNIRQRALKNVLKTAPQFVMRS